MQYYEDILQHDQAQPAQGHGGMTIGLSQFQSKQPGGLEWMLALPFTGRPGGYPMLSRGITLSAIRC